jgi:erythromycin esterase
MKIYLAALILVCSLMGYANDESWRKPLNLDFETASLEGWSVGGEGVNVLLDNTQAAAGRQSLSFIFVKDLSGGPWGYASASLPLAPFLGKRIRLSGALKTRDASRPFCLWLRADDNEDPVSFAFAPGKSPRGTTDWKQYSIEMDVPREAAALYFGAVMTGEGAAWMDNLSIGVLPAQGTQSLVIGGKVVDEKGKPVAGAIVAAKTLMHETALACVTSDREGGFIFACSPGLYSFTATAPGLTAGSLALRGFAKDTRDLVLTLNKGEGITLKGKIKVSQGKIPPDTYVIANRLEFLEPVIFYTRPQPDGSFQVTIPAGESYRLDLDAPGLKAVPVMMGPDSPGSCILKAFAPQPAPVEVVSWLKAKAIALRTPEPGHGFSDMEPLKKILGNARVVALGETTHGTREMFRMKHRFLEFLVERMGFSVFALEADWPEVLAVNDYVLEGKGDPGKALTHLYDVWNTEEVLALIRWMRAYNADPTHHNKVKFYGIDCQESKTGADHVAAYLEKVDPRFARQVAKSLSLLGKSTAFAQVDGLPEQECDTLEASIKEILHQFDREKDTYAAASSYRDWLETRQLARILQQFVELVRAYKTNDYTALNLRGRAMAENIKWILDNEAPGTKIMLWAHNFHISLEPYPGYPFVFMGTQLRRLLADDYLSIGFTFNRGSFQGADFRLSNSTRLLKRFNVDPYPGSWGETMSRTGIPFFFLDLRLIPQQGVVHDWFAVPHVFKWVNFIFDSEKEIEYLFQLPKMFDAVIFIEKTSRALPNPSSRRLKFPW